MLEPNLHPQDSNVRGLARTRTGRQKKDTTNRKTTQQRTKLISCFLNLTSMLLVETFNLVSQALAATSTGGGWFVALAVCLGREFAGEFCSPRSRDSTLKRVIGKREKDTCTCKAKGERVGIALLFSVALGEGRKMEQTPPLT